MLLLDAFGSARRICSYERLDPRLSACFRMNFSKFIKCKWLSLTVTSSDDAASKGASELSAPPQSSSTWPLVFICAATTCLKVEGGLWESACKSIPFWTSAETPLQLKLPLSKAEPFFSTSGFNSESYSSLCPAVTAR